MAVLYIRDVEPVVAKKIAELAKASGVSSTVYLKRLVETHVTMPMVVDVVGDYSALLEKLMVILADNTVVMEQLKEIIENTGGQKNG